MKSKKKNNGRKFAIMMIAAMLTLGACMAVTWWMNDGGTAAQLTAEAAPAGADVAKSASVAADTAAKAESSPLQDKFWILLAVGGAAALLALFQARYYFTSVKKSDPGTPRMQEISGYVREGAFAYMRRQRRVVFTVLIIVGLLLAFAANYPLIGKDGNFWVLSILIGFISGGTCSFLTGWFGMDMATYANCRTAAACRDEKDGLNKGLQVAFKAGSVLGLSVVGIGLAFISIWLLIMAKMHWATPQHVGDVMVSFGMGASFVALFARVGGGIYTKAADVGADLVGKVEAGIPEDDPRNPAVIADNVGDNVGDVAGMGADLYESYGGAILAAIAMAAYAVGFMDHDGATGQDKVWIFIVAPVAISAGGILLSAIGATLIRTKPNATLKELLSAMHRGVNFASAGVVVTSGAVCYYCFNGMDGVSWWGIWLATCMGLGSGLVIAKGSEIYTAYDYRPTQRVAESSSTGPATVIINGLAAGMMSTWIPILVVVIATVLAYGFSGGFHNPNMGLYGISLAAVGMLSTLGITLATDAYGPIADNAGGNAEMSGLGPEIRQRTDALDSLGNTTAAIGKGFAIGSAALTALGLIAAFTMLVQPEIEANGINFKDLISLTNPMVISGIFIGALLVFVFCAMTMTAVGKAALAMVEEVRRQFKADPGLMAGTSKPDYAKCVDISTEGALREMMIPSLLAIVVPVLVGVLFGVGGVVGMLGGGLATGFAMAIFMANAGGSWDNAKKYIESGELGGKYLKNAKGEYVDVEGNKVAKEKSKNPRHSAAVIGDTIGDPFKDTSGPSLNILVKLISMVAVSTAGVTLMVNHGKGLFEMMLTGIGAK